MVLESLFRGFLGRSSARKLKRYQRRVARINQLESSFSCLTDTELKEKTEIFKKRLRDGKEKINDLLPEAFACVREAAQRVIGQRHYDVQLVGGMVLHDGKIAEMRTGEGKTLVSTLPAYLNALTEKGVHIVTVNDYLAQRDSYNMGRIHEFLGLRVGCILHDMTDEARRDAYSADITYGTNNEFGFDYLRDNMKYDLESMVQRGHAFVLIDEVDSILIDEARTPLIISGPLEGQSDLYQSLDHIVKKLKTDDYDKDEKDRTVLLTEEGNEHAETLLKEADLLQTGTLYDTENIALVHHLVNALRAHTLFYKDKEYIVRNNEVVIVDEFTGRMMQGRRYSDGLHQAIEAKEHVEIQPENQTLASITFQNYFRLYDKLAGMTGTAATEADEFMEIYALDVIVVPTNLPVCRADKQDEIYKNQNAKYKAIAIEVERCVKKEQPVLIGTTSIEKSETLSSLLTEQKIQHNVLNARYHEHEAHIIAKAGVPATVTIATNMAGRGTDIQLGGNVEMITEDAIAGMEDGPEKEKVIFDIEESIAKAKEIVLKAGGLYVIGTERHESRRVDNQLRGRSGRQGDVGQSKFYLALDDDLLRIFSGGKLENLLIKIGFKEDDVIVHPLVSRTIESAQKKVESHNFEIRKNVLRYDDVMNDQRKVIFENRIDIMQSESVHDLIIDMRNRVIHSTLNANIPPSSYPEQWDVQKICTQCQNILNVNPDTSAWIEEEGIEESIFESRITTASDAILSEKESIADADAVSQLEKMIFLHTLDSLWRGHIVTLEHLRQSIGLRAYGQLDPLNEYKNDALELFESLLDGLRDQVVSLISHLEIVNAEKPQSSQRVALKEEDNINTNINVDVDSVIRSYQQLPSMQMHHVDPFSNQDLFTSPDANSSFISHQKDRRLSTLPIKDKSGKNKNLNQRVPRNAPCPCGSGKKYKFCHGKNGNLFYSA